MSRNDTVIPPPIRLSLDVVDDTGSVLDVPGSITSTRPYCRRGSMPGPTTAGFFQLNTFAALVADGFLTYSAVSTLNAIQFAYSRFGFPLGRDYAAAATAPPVSGRIFREYIHEAVVTRVAPLIANVPAAVGLHDDANPFGIGGAFGIEVLSIDSLNGGRWTLRSCLTSGGPIVVGGDSGISPVGAATFFRWIYRDTDAPRLTIEINGVPAFTIAGIVNLPVTGNECFNFGLFQGTTAGSAAGQTDRIYAGRYYIRELSGYAEE